MSEKRELIPSFGVAVATARHLNVAVNSSGVLAIVAKGVQAHGTTARAADPAATDISKQRTAILPLRGATSGTHVAAAAVVQYAKAYQADGGKVDDVATDAILLGTFLTSGAADGDYVDILYHD